MKKIAVIFITVLMITALTGCGNSTSTGGSNGSSNIPTVPSGSDTSDSDTSSTVPSEPYGELRQIEIDSVVYTLPMTGADLIAMGLSIAPARTRIAGR